MDEQRKTYLLKLVRGKDYRRALHAIAELHSANEPALAKVIPEATDLDDQRGFQTRVARIVLEKGVAGLVEYTPTGLLDKKVLESALARIKKNQP